MSYINIAHRGLELLENREWDSAIDHLSRALEQSPNPSWAIARSKALIGARRFREGLEDAEKAWYLAASRSNRKLLIDAQHRRAVAHYRLGEFANADCCCLYAMNMIKGGKSVEPTDFATTLVDSDGYWTQAAADAKRQAQEEAEQNEGGLRSSGGMNKASPETQQWRLLSTLRIQALVAMENLPAGDPARRCTVTQKPPDRDLARLAGDARQGNQPAAVPSSGKQTIGAAQEPGEIKLQEFQNATTINVAVLSRGVDKSKLSVEFQPWAIILDPIIYPGGSEGKYVLNTWAEVNPATCTYNVTPSKVELRLTKSSPGSWPRITKAEGDMKGVPTEQPTAAAPTPSDAPASANAAPQPAGNPGLPPRPTKNWDNIDVGDEDDGKDVNDFFKKLYKNATPEQQRAMMKSFTESSGTSLSTNWDDVKDRTIDAIPPDGVEAKKWP